MNKYFPRGVSSERGYWIDFEGLYNSLREGWDLIEIQNNSCKANRRAEKISHQKKYVCGKVVKIGNKFLILGLEKKLLGSVEGFKN